MKITIHAKKRLQQRAIPIEIIDLLLDFGSRANGLHGAEIVYFRRHDRLMIDQEIKRLRLPTKCLNTYLVQGIEGAVITAGYRTKKIHH